ncbi:hypothetical protein [Methylobacterium sp. E-066]|uniref:hypothetical protein n=1 Tax=Methylobacterium sp. E-066 TaxID=2836584 RepID=UPI001FBBF424|nr:hypothetical protein [Methylobacterium sp. E-066]MCJ2143683.1 hypothetical protein [Methylobacterium sp. E-066]
MLTAYLDHLQHASATAQIAGTLLSALLVGLGPFAVAALIDRVRVARRVSQGAH